MSHDEVLKVFLTFPYRFEIEHYTFNRPTIPVIDEQFMET